MLIQQTVATISRRSMQIKLRGVVHVHRTDSEGRWAFQDTRFMMAPWSSDGQHILKSGDDLTIYSKDDPSVVVWQGIISLNPCHPVTDPLYRYLVSAEQAGVPKQRWAHWFLNQYPAALIPAE